MKKCPYCAEEVQEAAIVCKHCGRDLPGVIEVGQIPTASINQKPVEKKGKPILLIMGALVGAVLGLCLICLIVSMIYSQTPKGRASATERAEESTAVAAATAAAPTETATRQPTATFTLEATETKKPTATFTPEATETKKPTATFTPEATETKKPTATDSLTATPSVNVQEVAYLNRAQELSSDCVKYLYVMAEQNTAAGEDITLMFDNEWKLNTAAALAGIKTTCAAMDEISPVPPRFQKMHSLLTSASKEFDLVVQYYAEGIDEFDVDKILKSSEHMSKGSDYVVQATSEMSVLNSNP